MRDFGTTRHSWWVSGHSAEHQQLTSQPANDEVKAFHARFQGFPSSTHWPTCLRTKKGIILTVNSSQNRDMEYVEPNK